MFNNAQVPRLQAYTPPVAPVAPPPLPPPPPPLPVGGGYSYAPPPATPATPVAQPGANDPIHYSTGFGALALADLANIVAHPIQTIKSLFIVSKDVLGLQTKRGVTIAAAPAVMAQFQQAARDVDAAPFKHLLPFFDHALDRWAEGRFEELRPQVQDRLAQRAWHAVSLEWPDGGSGRDRLAEVLMLNGVADTATDGQIVRGLQGTNRIQVKDSSPMDYFYPLARAGDALVLRRNLAVLPGQKPLSETFKGYLSQNVAVHAEV